MHSHFRGTLADLAWHPASTAPQPADLDLSAMARAALNYLRGNPEAARDYECKFSLGPLGIPAHVPLLASNQFGFDPIALGDTDCRMDWQYAHMREMAGGAAAEAVERGVYQRIRRYQRADGLLWMNQGAWIGPLTSPSALAGIKHEWASSWASGKWLYRLADEYARTGDAATKAAARQVFAGLRRLPRWDGPRAYLPYGPSAWKDGEWLHLRDADRNQGWGAEHSHAYPFFVEPLVRYYECCGDAEALDLARAVTEGHLAGTQPDMEELRIDPATGAFHRHVHLHTHELWGVAHLGVVTGERRYLEWAQRAYEFVLSQGTDYGWFPEYIPQSEYRTEICVVGDMASLATQLARGLGPHYYDHLERIIRNELRRAQFFLTPAFLALFHRLHAGKDPAVVAAAITELRRLEGGFVAQAAFDDWVGFPGSLGEPGLYRNGIQMMGCCPPEGMRALWEAWNAVVEERPEGVYVNLALSRVHPAATVAASRPEDGTLTVTPHRSGRLLLRPPGWVDRATVRLTAGGAALPVAWDGPAQAYVAVPAARAGVPLNLSWSVPQFTQTFVPQSVPGRTAPLTVTWVGNEVRAISPRGQFLPMFGG